MTPTRLRRRIGRRAATVALAAVGTIAATAGSAVAADVYVDYDFNGTTNIASTGSNVTLGPAVMYTTVADDGTFVGDMTLPGTRTEFKLAGFIPVTADIDFIPTKPTTGQMIRVGRYRTLTSSSSYYVRLSNIAVVGFPLFAGSQCRTKDPVLMDANTPEGEYFTIADGGRLTGTYTIGDFQNCGLNTWLINTIIPGSGNTVDLQLTGGRPGTP
ncbi:hypothetical protein [Mumia sp. DW29H23]|uniref:hypothetical protein n=1 Tax=Mumia sp. DW29H23 TaxID=3421241 RepID=UPI003D68A51A